MQESATIESFHGNIAKTLLYIFPDIGLDPVKVYSNWSSFHNTVQPHFSNANPLRAGTRTIIVNIFINSLQLSTGRFLITEEIFSLSLQQKKDLIHMYPKTGKK